MLAIFAFLLIAGLVLRFTLGLLRIALVAAVLVVLAVVLVTGVTGAALIGAIAHIL